MERSPEDANLTPEAESEAEKILRSIMRRINMLRSRKREVFKYVVYIVTRFGFFTFYIFFNFTF